MGEAFHAQQAAELEAEAAESRNSRSGAAGLPWWQFAIFIIFIITAWQINVNPNLTEAYNFIIAGIGLTIYASFLSYLIAIVLGLLAGMGRISRNVVIRNIATFYVEFIRGIPMLVLIFFIALVGVPTAVDWLNEMGFTLIDNKSISTFTRAVIALSVTYGAFLAEIFRAGIQSIHDGQMEAARSQGMSYPQAMRYIILPQAVRNILPALGNDFVAMVKDSSLVSLLAVNDITYKAKLYSGSSFRFRESYTILSLLYLLMTVILSWVVSRLERRLRDGR